MGDFLDVLIPTCDRPVALGVTLAGLLGQDQSDFDVIISDQSEGNDPFELAPIQTLIRAFEIHGQRVKCLRHLPRRGMAEQRQFLLEQSQARYILFLDDDLLCEPWVVRLLIETIERDRCGFIGMPPIGLSYLHDVRPHQHNIEIWDGPVRPEPFKWEDFPWARHEVHNAANPYHLQQKLGASQNRLIRYRVAWVGACVLYDRRKLIDIGGFRFWKDLPPNHCGEDVMAQVLLLRRYGGCGILPSGVYHQELPTKVSDRANNTHELIRRAIMLEERENLHGDNPRGESCDHHWGWERSRRGNGERAGRGGRGNRRR